MSSFLVSVVQRAASASPLYLGIFIVVSHIGMVGLLVRETEVGNNLYHHLDDITIEGDVSNCDKIIILV